MKRYNEDGLQCDTCMGNTGCSDWLSSIHLYGCGISSRAYANKEQVEWLLEYHENKGGKMEDLCFMVGDKVFTTRFGNGVVDKVGGQGFGSYTVRVKFKEAGIVWYTPQGFYHTSDTERSLFHGHDLKISMVEKLPVRKQVYWIYLYVWNNVVETSALFFTEEDCYASMQILRDGGNSVIKEPFKIEV